MSAWLKEARLVVLILGATEGLQWELQRIIDHGLANKLAVIVPPVARPQVQARMEANWSLLEKAFGSLALDAHQLNRMILLCRIEGESIAFTADERGRGVYELATLVAGRSNASLDERVGAALDATATTVHRPSAIPVGRPAQPPLSPRRAGLVYVDVSAWPVGLGARLVRRITPSSLLALQAASSSAHVSALIARCIALLQAGKTVLIECALEDSERDQVLAAALKQGVPTVVVTKDPPALPVVLVEASSVEATATAVLDAVRRWGTVAEEAPGGASGTSP